MTRAALLALVLCVPSLARAQDDAFMRTLNRVFGDRVEAYEEDRATPDRERRCGRGGDGLSPGFWGGIGSRRRDVEVEQRISVGARGLLTEEFKAGIRLPNPLLRDFPILVRANIPLAVPIEQGRNGVAELPSFGAAVLYRTTCDAFRLEFGAQFYPSAEGTPEPSAFFDVLDAALTAGPEGDLAWMPRAEWGFQPYVRSRLRSRDTDFAASLEFGMRMSRVRLRNWLGAQSGWVGGFWLDFGFMFPNALGLRIGGRFAVSFSSLFPAQEVLPMRFVGTVGISPYYALALLIEAGAAISPLSPTARSALGPVATLSVRLYIDATDLHMDSE